MEVHNHKQELDQPRGEYEVPTITDLGSFVELTLTHPKPPPPVPTKNGLGGQDNGIVSVG